MARMKKEDVERIIQREMPGYRVAPQRGGPGADAPRKRATAGAGTPDLEALKRKYLSKEPKTSGSAATGRDSVHTRRNEDDEIVVVEPDSVVDPWDRVSRRKAVVVSGREKRIVGKQG